MISRKSIGVSVAVLSSLAFPAMADNCTGYDVLVAQTVETTDLGKGQTLTVWKNHSVVTSEDSMYKALAGECSGTILTTPDGKPQSMGYCARRDKDGDTASISWHVAPGADKGMWKITGGTGKYSGKQGSGWFQNVLSDGKMSLAKWGGTCN